MSPGESRRDQSQIIAWKIFGLCSVLSQALSVLQTNPTKYGEQAICGDFELTAVNDPLRSTAASFHFFLIHVQQRIWCQYFSRRITNEPLYRATMSRRRRFWASS